MTLSTPKINVTPEAIRNSSMPMIMPLVSWVTTHDPVPRQRINASRSTSYPIEPGVTAGGECRRTLGSGVALLLLPLLLELEDGLPRRALEVVDVGILRLRQAVADDVV